MKPTEFLNELSNEKLAKYKTAAAADAKKADTEGDYKRGDKRFSGIVKATKKQFANDEKGITEMDSEGYKGSRDDYELGKGKEHTGKATTTDKMLKAAKKAWEYATEPVDAPNMDTYKKHRAKNIANIRKNKGVAEGTYDNRDAYTKDVDNSQTGFDRAAGHRDSERHDLDVQRPVVASPQEWGLKINGKVWTKDGKSVTFASKEQALKARQTLLARRPELEIGLLTRGGVTEETMNEGVPSDNDMGVVPDARSGTNTKMTLGQWKQMWLKKMPHADQGMFRYPPAMNGSFIAYFDGWENTPGARWDPMQAMEEEKQRLDPKCWTGYKKQGTKMKAGVRVNNCVPVKESAIMQGVKQLDEGWKEKLGAAALAGSMALGAGAAHSRVTPDGEGGYTGGLKPTATVNAPTDNKPAADAPSGFSKEYLQKAANPDRLGRFLISVEKAQELLKNMP